MSDGARLSYLRGLTPDSMFILCSFWQVWAHHSPDTASYQLYLGWAPYGEGLPDQIARATIPYALSDSAFEQAAAHQLAQLQRCIESVFES